MADTEKAAKLALARKKLREFEARRTGSSPSSQDGGTNIVEGRSSSLSNGSSIRQDDMSVVDVHDNATIATLSSNCSSAAFKISPHQNGNSEVADTPSVQSLDSTERSRLIHDRDRAVEAYESVKAQLEQLHGHYSQLHTAYSQISNSGAHSDMEKQVLQLQHALAIMVEEKTSLQSELRQSNDRCAQLQQLQELAASTSSPTASADTAHLQRALEENRRLLEACNNELAAERRHSADTMAKLQTIQHERSEAQARMKAALRDKDVTMRELQSVKSELQMKELHLRQLNAHQTPSVDSSELDTLHARIASLESELKEAKCSNHASNSDADEAKRQFNTYSQELLAKNRDLADQLESSNRLRNSAESKVKELEVQLEMLAKDIGRSSDSGSGEPAVSSHAEVKVSSEDIEARIAEAIRSVVKHWQGLLEREEQSREEIVLAKDRLLFEREEALAELNLRCRNLEQISQSRGDDNELLSMSQQLQNEKATVSRAVAQNKELKEQLIETEDRLVSLTEEKLQCELARQAAEHESRELRRQIDLTAAGLVGPEQADAGATTQTESTHLNDTHSQVIGGDGHSQSASPSNPTDNSDQTTETTTSKTTSSDVESRLENTLRELSEVRNELRRSHTQNEEMNQIMMLNAEDENQNSFHVELGQAMNRIHSLVAENESLREQLVDTQTLLPMPASENASPVRPQTLDASVQSDVVPVDNGVPALANLESSPVPDVEVLEPPVAVHFHSPVKTSRQSVGSEEWAREELERKFSDVMRRNAELQEIVEKTEHINLQLQLENDTIADHVILYQHQRRLIRERLRVKDQQLSTLESERTKVSERCQELQKALMRVLGKNGALREYSVRPHSPSAKQAAAARRVSRTYSHSTVDELSGDEDVVVSVDEQVPSRDEVAERERLNDARTSSPELGLATGSSPLPGDSPDGHSDADVQQLLNLINDISSASTPACNDKLHCTQCIGELKNV